jgi:ABC-type multidrug transport system fused ATPase/permease subunit
MLSTIVLGLLFYYNIKLGLIAFFIILGLFLYAKFFPKDKEIQNKEIYKKEKKYKIIKEPDNLEHEYDYKGDEEIEYSYINTEIETQVVEAMSNKKRNSGIDRISTETILRGKESKTLPISSAFGSNKEPVSVGGEGTISGYELIQQE